ncbi:amino acid ABC transporter permease [Aestuariivirga sp.]|uniref:amino acid ABC transporter permease n=1 Tax=Aestuariivirga sp. TaxID=2650926 RepID=UPI003BACCA65
MDSFLELATKYTPYILTGAVVTFKLTVFSLAVSLPLGLAIALMGLAKRRLVRGLALFYVELIRGTPALLQLFIVYFGLTSWGIRLDPIPAATITLGVIGGAYVAEIFRAGIESVDRGQIEAAKSIGMRDPQIMRRIVLPQALQLVIPPLTNFLIALIKDTSLALTISVPEIMYRAYDVASQTFRSMDVYAITGVIYLMICVPLSFFVRRLEKRSHRHQGR